MDQIANVFKKCSGRALQAVALARQFAGQNGAALIGSEDLLYGVFQVTPEIFPTLSNTALVEQLHQLRPPNSPPLPHSQDMGITGDLQRSLEIAMHTAAEQGCREVRTEHLLLGLVQVQTSHAAIVLATIGITKAEALRNAFDCSTPEAEPVLLMNADGPDL